MLTKLLYGITALILALALGGFAVQTARLSKAENRAVEAANLAGEYQRSLESFTASAITRAYPAYGPPAGSASVGIAVAAPRTPTVVWSLACAAVSATVNDSRSQPNPDA